MLWWTTKKKAAWSFDGSLKAARLGVTALGVSALAWGVGCARISDPGALVLPPASKPVAKQVLLESPAAIERALWQGDVALALHSASAYASTHPGDVQNQKLFAKVQEDADVLIARQLQLLESALKRHEYPEAERLLLELEAFPLSVQDAYTLSQRRNQLKEAKLKAVQDLETAEKNILDAMRRQQSKLAMRILVAHTPLLSGASLEQKERWERIKTVLAVRLERENGHKSRESGAQPSRPQDQVEMASIRRAIKAAKRAERKRQFFIAIIEYRDVLDMDPSNAIAKSALMRLNSQRLQLVSLYLDKAERHFLAQELQLAVPFYRKVLKLDSGNTKALEGLRMYENLQRLAGQRAASR